MSTPILTEVLKSNPSAVIDLFEADFTAAGYSVPIVRFHAGTNGLTTNVVWNANTYTAFPMEFSGFEWDGSGKLPNPKVSLANVQGAITALNFQYNDLIGVKITRRRTFMKFLDAVNFVGGVNADADPTAEFPKEIYFVDRKIVENNNVVEYELASALDLSNSSLPKRIIAQNICMWKYQSSECTWSASPGPYLDEYGNSTTAPNDKCGKRLSDCKKRFYARKVYILPFGGFPGSGLMR